MSLQNRRSLLKIYLEYLVIFIDSHYLDVLFTLYHVCEHVFIFFSFTCLLLCGKIGDGILYSNDLVRQKRTVKEKAELEARICLHSNETFHIHQRNVPQCTYDSFILLSLLSVDVGTNSSPLMMPLDFVFCFLTLFVPHTQSIQQSSFEMCEHRFQRSLNES